MEQLTQHFFREHLSTVFQVDAAGMDPVPLELVDVNDLGSTPQQDQFVVLFRGPLDRPLPQMIYNFRRDGVAPFELFIVPVAQEKDGMSYEAVFNRFVEDHS